MRETVDRISTGRAGVKLAATWATSVDEVREAQRLRFRIFAGEMGARLAPGRATLEGHDIDRFDDFCAHLLIRAHAANDGAPPRVVGTYRVLTPEAALRAGGYYSETEFDLARLRPLRRRMAELGRSCVDPAWRTGGTILSLWAALGDFMVRHRLDIAFGCASVSSSDGGHRAASVWRHVSLHHLAPVERRAVPLHPATLPASCDAIDAALPPLIKGYLRCGAEVLGPPGFDPDFDTADFPMLMRFDNLPHRHHRRFVDSGRHRPIDRSVPPSA